MHPYLGVTTTRPNLQAGFSRPRKPKRESFHEVRVHRFSRKHRRKRRNNTYNGVLQAPPARGERLSVVYRDEERRKLLSLLSGPIVWVARELVSGDDFVATASSLYRIEYLS